MLAYILLVSGIIFVYQIMTQPQLYREIVEKNFIFYFYFILIYIKIFKSINKYKLKFLC
jgi:hypothetical protein